MKNSLFIIILCGIMWLAGCSQGTIPAERLEFSYLDEKALENPSQEFTYSEVDGVYVHDYIDQNKDKSVRWTATVVRIQDDQTFELKEPLLPAILVTVSEAPSQPVEAGDLVTLTGVLTGYGETFGKDPVWVVRPARLETTTEEERAAVEAFRKEAETAKKETDPE
ncbi:hypothetical protein JOC95_000172 [Bacillus tianshenii]|uniref:Lipoprotein n=1 Tax=Sutcliffiella tianshenii TaxID=1463404 RepID=A0ABS2NUK2_9BACI|nr:hypothetical protein [Bacillus tianshenii]MBM7618330.1 hypothetical protein [Bacillus tianshenii]